MKNSGPLFELIDQLREEWKGTLTVTEICELAGVQKGSYYAWRKAEPNREKKKQQDLHDYERLQTAVRKNGYDLGVEGLYMWIKHNDPEGVMNKKKIRRIRKRFGMTCSVRSIRPRRLRESKNTNFKCPNVLAREFHRYPPRTVITGDITYLHYGNGEKAYLTSFRDSRTHEILGYDVSESLEAASTIKAFHRLIEDHGSELNDVRLVHTDHGSQYTSNEFCDLVAEYGFIQSMSRVGNCHDNAGQESMQGHAKDDLSLDLREARTFEDVVAAVDRYMPYHNDRRYQLGLDELAPSQYYRFWLTGEYPYDDGKEHPRPVAAGDPQVLVRRAARLYRALQKEDVAADKEY